MNVRASPLAAGSLLVASIAATALAAGQSQAPVVDLRDMKTLSGPELAGALVGKTVDSSPQGLGIRGQGMNESFFGNGTYSRDTDRVFAFGTYRITADRICITADRAPSSPDCRSLYRSGKGDLYFSRPSAAGNERVWRIVVAPIVEQRP